MDKAELRKEIRKRYKLSSPEDRSRWSEEVCARLHEMEAVIKANTIMAFYPLPDEADIRPLLHRLYNEGKRILLPEVLDSNSLAIRLFNPDAEMLSGTLGTKVPDTENFKDTSCIDVVLVPGMAFDRTGHRLGRGKGYYDRFLSTLPAATMKIAVYLPYQIVGHVPSEEHDIIMDYV